MGERFMLVSVDSLTLGSIIIDICAMQIEPPAWFTRRRGFWFLIALFLLYIFGFKMGWGVS